MGEKILFHCYCTGVTQKRVLRAMAGLSGFDVDAIRNHTGACTGCQSCRRELEELVEAVQVGSIRVSTRGDGAG